MAVFEHNEKGIMLEAGDTINISFSLDLETVVTSGEKGGMVEVGYCLNDQFVILEEKISDQFNITAQMDINGEYFFYIINKVSGYQVIQDGQIKIN